jgi:hypothetical protein
LIFFCAPFLLFSRFLPTHFSQYHKTPSTKALQAKKRLEKRLLEELKAQKFFKAEVENPALTLGSGSCTEDSESVSGGDDDDGVEVEKQAEKVVDSGVEVAIVARVGRYVKVPEPCKESTLNEDYSQGMRSRNTSLTMTEKNRNFESQSAPSSRSGSVSRSGRGSGNGNGSANVRSSSSSSSSVNRSTSSIDRDPRVVLEAGIVRRQGLGSARLRPVAPTVATPPSSSHITTSRQGSAVVRGICIQGEDASTLPVKLCGVSAYAVTGSRKRADSLPVGALVVGGECHSGVVESCVLGIEGAEGAVLQLENVSGLEVAEEEGVPGIDGAAICDTIGVLDEHQDTDGAFVGWGYGVDSLSLSQSMSDSETETETCISSTTATVATGITIATPCLASVSTITFGTRPLLSDFSLPQSNKVVMKEFIQSEDLESNSLKNFRRSRALDFACETLGVDAEDRSVLVTESNELCSTGKAIDPRCLSTTLNSHTYPKNCSVHDDMNDRTEVPWSDVAQAAAILTPSRRKCRHTEGTQVLSDMQDVSNKVELTSKEVENSKDCGNLRISNDNRTIDFDCSVRDKEDKVVNRSGYERAKYTSCAEKLLSLSVSDSRKSSQDTVNSSATTVSCTSSISSSDRLTVTPLELGLKTPTPLFNQMLSSHPSSTPLTNQSHVAHTCDGSDQSCHKPPIRTLAPTAKSTSTDLSPLPINVNPVNPATPLQHTAETAIVNNERNGADCCSVTEMTAAMQVDPALNHMPYKNATGTGNRKYNSDISPLKNTDLETVIFNPPRVIGPHPRVMLSDYYHHIGMIFPVAYSALGHR